MLVDADLPPAHVKRLAGNIYRASRRIQELLQDLLNVSRGKSRPPEMCRLREVASAACESLAAAAEAQGVDREPLDSAGNRAARSSAAAWSGPSST